MLIQHVYGSHKPATAAVSIRVAISSLRKKIRSGGIRILAERGVGYKIEVSHVPALNRRLSDNILLALNLARAIEEAEIAGHLEVALAIAESNRQKWNKRLG